MEWRASAPGKVLLAGEYAILDGHPAVVMAVKRRAMATLSDQPQSLSPFLWAAREEIALRLGETSDAAARAARVVVDSSALEQARRKLGLGSSAAATVAAVALALGPTEDTPLVYEIAHSAHASAQAKRGARGSGADVAASVHGGILRLQRQGEDQVLAIQSLPRPSAELLLVWTGTPADTPSLVAQVRAHQGRDPALHAALLAALGAAAEAVAQALLGSDLPALIQAIHEGANALFALAEHTQAPLIPPTFLQVSSLARDHGGAAKPTGAGGGDLILCVFGSLPAARAFAEIAHRQGMTLLSADVDPQGVQLAVGP